MGGRVKVELSVVREVENARRKVGVEGGRAESGRVPLLNTC